jgi:hypothetical protein
MVGKVYLPELTLMCTFESNYFLIFFIAIYSLSPFFTAITSPKEPFPKACAI